MTKILKRELMYFWYYFNLQFRQIAGYWNFRLILGSFISVFGKEKCMYGAIPIAASFAEKGIEDNGLAAFMMHSILLNPQLLFYSAALGPSVLAIGFTSCFLYGIVAGLCVRLLSGNRKFFNFAFFPPLQAGTLSLIWFCIF
ncbi:hypothetical protein Holit_00672 [Hollandina sp. SP2]